MQNGGRSRFVEVTDKEISEIEINSVPKNTKTIIRLRPGDYREYSHRLRFREYSPIRSHAEFIVPPGRSKSILNVKKKQAPLRLV